MRKIFTTILLVAGLLIPSLANAQAPSITSIDPTAGTVASGKGYFATAVNGQTAVANSNLFSFNVATNCKNGSLYVTKATLTYTNSAGESKEEILSNLGTANIANTPGRQLWGTTTSNKNNLRIQVNLTNIKNAGAPDFTVIIQMAGSTASSGYESFGFNDPDLDGVSVDGQNVSITFKTGQSGGGDSGVVDPDVEYATQFAWDTPLMMGNGTLFTIPQTDEETPVYIKTNSNVQLSNFMFTDAACSNPVSFDSDEITSSPDGLVYSKILSLNWFSYYVKYTGTPIEFTFVQGTYDSNGGDTPTGPTPPAGSIEVQWNTDVTPGEAGDKSYYFYGKDAYAQIKTSSTNSNLTNSGATLKKNNTENVSMDAVLEEDGYVYNLGQLESDAFYVFDFYCPTKTYTFSIVETQEQVKEPVEVFAGPSENTWDPNQVYFYKATGNGEVTVNVAYSPSSLADVPFVYSDEEHTTPLSNVTFADLGNGQYSYKFSVSENNVYYFFFTPENSTYVVASLKFEPDTDQPEEPDYMDALPSNTFVNDGVEQAVYVYWSETISAVEENGSLTASLTTPEDQVVPVTLSIVSYNPEDGDNYTNNALKFDAAAAIAQYGPGAYTLTVPSELVKNADGKVNDLVEADFEMEAQVEESDVEATVVVEAAQIIISWNELPISIYDNYAEIVITNTEDAEDVLTFKMNEGAVISQDGKSIEVTIAEDALAYQGKYVLTIAEGSFLINETGYNQAVSYAFTYTYSGVSSIGAVDNDAVIYNLQGQKVTNPTKGIYIINGKKVAVK